MAGEPLVKEFFEEVWETHKRKNADYSDAGSEDGGDPLSNFRYSEKAGADSFTGSLVRLTDKWNRLVNLNKKRLQGGSNAVEGETIEDAILDLAGYCGIAYALYKKDVQGESFEDLVDREYRGGIEETEEDFEKKEEITYPKEKDGKIYTNGGPTTTYVEEENLPELEVSNSGDMDE